MINSGRKLIGPFKQLLTLRQLPLKGPITDNQLEILSEGGVLVEDGILVNVGSFEELKKEGITQIEYLDEPLVALPGFVDCHTHICFAGSRASDYAMRMSGNSYQEIAATGGGIWDTVLKTRQASEAELAQGVLTRSARLLENGVTTVEVKSGYGLQIQDELKMLRAIKKASEISAADLISTCLPAHIKPRDFEGNEMEYIRHLIDHFFPEVKKSNLSSRADIFVEDGAFSKEAASLYLSKVKKMGFELTVHADQFSTGGSQLAIEMGALSADHLEASQAKEIAALAGSSVIPVALPGASVGLGCSFAPGRKLLDAGASLAIASDWNPGSAPMGDLLCLSSIFGAFEKLTIAETFAGICFRAAKALGLSDRGRLDANMLADIVGFPCQDYREILYHQGQLSPQKVWKRGLVQHRSISTS